MESRISKKSSEIKSKNSKSNSKRYSKEEDEENLPKIMEKTTGKELYESYKRDLGISEFTMKRAIKSVGEWII